MNKSKIIIIIILFILIGLSIAFGPKIVNKINYTLLVNSESFKNSDAKTKFDLLDNSEFRNSCSDSEVEKVVLMLAENVVSGNNVFDKIDLLDSLDFIHYGSDELRKRLIESFLDTPNIDDSTYIRFLFKVCRSTDFKIVAEHIEEKKYVLSAKVADELRNNLKYVSNNKSVEQIWENILNRNSGDLKLGSIERANKVVENSDIDSKISFFKSREYSKYLSSEMKDKVIDSILSSKIEESKLIDFLFNICSSEDFEYVGDRLIKTGFRLDSKIIIKIKDEMKNHRYNSDSWSKVFQNDYDYNYKYLKEKVKSVVEGKSLEETLELYGSLPFLTYADEDMRKQLIDSMSHMLITDSGKIVFFLFETCDEKEFVFISNRIEETGCFWTARVIVDIINQVNRKRKKEYSKIWNNIVEKSRQLRKERVLKQAEELEKTGSYKEKLKFYRSSDFRYLPKDLRDNFYKKLVEDGPEVTLEDKVDAIDSLRNINLNHSDAADLVNIRGKMIKSVVEDPNVDDTKLRMLLVSLDGIEAGYAIRCMAEKKIFLTKYLVATMVAFEKFDGVDKGILAKLFRDNPIAKHELIIKAKECIEYNSNKKLVKIRDYFDEFLKIEPDSQLFKDIGLLPSFNVKTGRRYFKPNQKEQTEEITGSVDEYLNIQKRISEHLDKVLAEYEEEIRNSSHAKDFHPDYGKKKK